ELWEMVMDAYINTSNQDLKSKLRAQIDQVYDGTVKKYGSDWTNNHFNDDIMWWAMASARAYQLTGEQKYIDQAIKHFDFVYDTQWDGSFLNGGIWWQNSDHSTKNACINFPAAEAAVYLYNITKNAHYLDAAEKIYRWGKTMLTDGNGKVYDRIEVVNGVCTDSTHYNQGTFIGSAVGLYNITGNTVYLDDAVKATKYTKNSLVDANGILNYEGGNGDLKGGKTILVRNLAMLQKALDKRDESNYAEFAQELNEWIATNVQTAWNNRNSENIIDGNWNGKLISGTYQSWSSAAAVEALNVIKPQDVTVDDNISKNPYNAIQAENYDAAYGVGIEGCNEGTLQLGGIQSGYYAVYKNVDFGTDGANGFIARAASETGGGNIEIRLDSLTGTLIGTSNVQGTGSWSNFTDADTVITNTTGIHDVYLVFTRTNDQYLFNLNWFKFTKSDPTRTDAYTRLKSGNFSESSGLSRDETWNFLKGIHNNAYAGYRGIDFGSGAAGITVHVQSGNQGGFIDVKLDSIDGSIVGTVDIPALGNWNDWTDILTNIDDSQAKGVHNVYLIFRGKNNSDYPCNLDWFTFTTVKGVNRDAYGKIEAENYTAGTGFGTENGGGQKYLAGINGSNNPYAMYNYIDFGATSPAKFYVNAASATSGGTIEARIDGINGPVIAICNVPGTGGWQNFTVSSADVTASVNGKHVVYLLFKGSSWLFNLDKFTFGDPGVFTAPVTPPAPEPDNVPPGDVQNVQVIRNDGGIQLFWDGPYDIDAKKVQITVSKNGEQIGDMVNADRGIQTATITGLKADAHYTIGIKAVDLSGNISKGIKIETSNLPSFTLTANRRVLKDGDSFDDYMPLTFRVWDNLSNILSAKVHIGGKVYTIGPKTRESIDIDMAGMSGSWTADVVIKDMAGNVLESSLKFNVTTSIESMRKLIGRYKISKDLKMPLIAQLLNNIAQVEHQLHMNREDKAARHMQDFVKHLNNPALSRSVSDKAKSVLNADAQTLINAWQGDNKK
ncbi:MAG TPA: glycosyl hydrolase, partial [Clostridiaceae bacterium]|nr:glycosyl hydrolase [Clostridiaceae bacterium]